jgi:hypothetical protein
MFAVHRLVMAMPDDMPLSANVGAGLARLDVTISIVGIEGQSTSFDQPEKSCAFGCCSFVTAWAGKAHAPVAEICSKCDGMFSGTTWLLSRIVIGGKDKMGQVVRQLYLSGEDYTIYRTLQGVNVHFADCRARERTQRAKYEKISQKLVRLRFLTGQMAPWAFAPNPFVKRAGFYDHQIAQAIYLALQGKPDEASQILDAGLGLAEDRITNENRVRYLFACLLVGLIPGIALWLNWLPPGEICAPYLAAAAAGAAGAVFSIALRVQDLNLKPFAQSVMNYVMGALRVLIGFVAGAIILFIINGTIFGEGIVKVFKTISMTELSAESWKCILLAGFLGGFAERLVPSLLKNLQSGVENRVADDRNSGAPGKQLPPTVNLQYPRASAWM